MNAIECSRASGWEVFKMTQDRGKNSMQGEASELMNAIACRALGGEVFKMTQDREKNSM